MIPPESSSSSQQALLVPRLLWVSLTMSQIIYVFVARSTIQGAPLGDGLPVLPFVAAACLVGALVVPRLMARHLLKATLGADLTIATVTTQQLVTTLFTALLVRFALIEAVGVIGFVSSMVSQDPTKIYPYAAVGVVAMLINFPSEGKLRDLGR